MKTVTGVISVPCGDRDWRYLWLRRKPVTLSYMYTVEDDASVGVVLWTEVGR